MRKLLLALFVTLFASVAFAQSNPGLTRGQVPTAGQWNSYFSAKQDYLGYVPVNRGGDTMFGPLKMFAPTGTQAGLVVTPGNTPTAPANGSIWVTGAGMFVQVSGATIGPIGNSSVGGPGSSTVGHIATWNNTSGSLLADSGTALPAGTIVTTTATQTLTNKSIDASQINSGTLPVNRGGTGITAGTSGGVPYFSSTSALASSAALTASQLVLGGGAGAAPASLGSLGTTTTLYHGNASGAGSFASVAYADVASGAISTSANYRANAASTLLGPNAVWSAAGTVALTSGASVALDMSTGINYTLTIATAATLAAPSNTKVGQSGVIRVLQDATGSRTLAYNSAYKWSNGSACVITPAANAVTYIFYFTFSSSEILLNCVLNVQ